MMADINDQVKEDAIKKGTKYLQQMSQRAAVRGHQLRFKPFATCENLIFMQLTILLLRLQARSTQATFSSSGNIGQSSNL